MYAKRRFIYIYIFYWDLINYDWNVILSCNVWFRIFAHYTEIFDFAFFFFANKFHNKEWLTHNKYIQVTFKTCTS